MKQLTQRILSLVLLVALFASLCIMAYADTANGFNYMPGDEAPSDIILTDGSAIIRLTTVLGKKALTPSYAKAAAEHTARVLYENGQEYQPVMGGDNTYIFMVQAPLAIAYLKTNRLYIGVKSNFVVVSFGYEEGDELTWGLLKGDDVETATEEIAAGTVSFKDNLGTITLTAAETAMLSTESYVLVIPYDGIQNIGAAGTEFLSVLTVKPGALIKSTSTSSGKTGTGSATTAGKGTGTTASTAKPGSSSSPTSTVKPGSTAKPTSSPASTGTPKSTSTPKVTSTPTPTSTPRVTNTPKPTSTPKVTSTPKPSSTSTPGSSGSSSSEVKISSSNGSGSSAGFDYNNGNISIGTQDGSININTGTGDVSTSTDTVQPENGQNYEFIIPGVNG